MKRARGDNQSDIILDQECSDQLWVQSFFEQCVTHLSKEILDKQGTFVFEHRPLGDDSASVRVSIQCDFEIPASFLDPKFEGTHVGLSLVLWKRLKHYQTCFAFKIGDRIREELIKSGFPHEIETYHSSLGRSGEFGFTVMVLKKKK
jgi:hypothetical protein